MAPIFSYEPKVFAINVSLFLDRLSERLFLWGVASLFCSDVVVLFRQLLYVLEAPTFSYQPKVIVMNVKSFYIKQRKRLFLSYVASLFCSGVIVLFCQLLHGVLEASTFFCDPKQPLIMPRISTET